MLDNLITFKKGQINNQSTLSLNKGDEELMKHIRKRNDNRWEYRITKEGITKSVYAKTQKELLKKVKQLKPDKTIKNNITFLFLAKEWYTKFKQDIKSA